MKYHLTQFSNGKPAQPKRAACNPNIKDRPDVWIFPAEQFRAHFAKDMACKSCQRIDLAHIR